MAEEEQRTTCQTCKADLPKPGATFCRECYSWQVPKCDVCQQQLPEGAKRCNGCGTYKKGFLSHLPLSQDVLTLLVALVAVISPLITGVLYSYDRQSHTKFRVGGADDKHVYVKVWNTGRQPSKLLGYHLSLKNTGLHDETVELDLSDEDRKHGNDVIALGQPVTIGLVSADPNWLPNPGHTEGFTSDEFKKYDGKPASLNIDVEESWWTRTRSDDFSVRQIRAFLCGVCSDAQP